MIRHYFLHNKQILLLCYSSRFWYTVCIMKQIILTLGIVVVIAVLVHFVSAPKKQQTETQPLSTNTATTATTDESGLTIAQSQPLAPVVSEPAKKTAELPTTNTKTMNTTTPNQTDVQLTTTKSGLRYAVLSPGTGPKVEAGDKVEAHYTGRLTDGTVFDSSSGKKPLPFTVGVGQVIAGWDEGIVGMQVGEKKILVIPAELAYGNRSIGSIPANSPLVFQVELTKIVGK
jgi:FKBP-type peptidyl-prolyl cis-trans isomerase